MNSNKRAASEDLTGAVEDYLKAIYAIESTAGPAATTVIATKLGVAPASVSAMIKRLADQGLVGYARYQGVTLSDEGRRATLRILRRHRIIEAYLVQALGYHWEEVHDEAELLEHAVSDLLVERMAQAIGDPVVDPHGAPIPSQDGTIDDRQLHLLSEALVGALVRIAGVEDEDPALLRYLAELGLTPGKTVRLVQRAPFSGPVTLRLENGEERVVGAELTRQLRVE